MGPSEDLQDPLYLTTAMGQDEIWAVVIAEALRETIRELRLGKRFVYVHEAVSDPAPFQYLLPLGTEAAAPISYYCVAGGSLGWSMPASLGIKLEPSGWQGIETGLVVVATGDGSSLFYPQTWWTAAHSQLGVLYIITNNHEYPTLQLGLQTVVQAYGSVPGYEWQPRTLDPDHLRLQSPALDFVALARTLGGQDGEIVRRPGDVKPAIRRGAEYVMQNRRSYVLDMRTAQDPPTTPPTGKPARKVSARYLAQPALDVFHRRGSTGRAASAASDEAAADPASRLPLIF